MNAIMKPDGSIVIPKPIRDRLGLQGGDPVDFRESADGGVALVRVAGKEGESRFAKWRGHAGPGPTTDEIMAMTRGED